MNINRALPIALDVVGKLKPHCVRIDIAGSIRRKQSEVGDIEVVCQPKTMAVTDLFAEIEEPAGLQLEYRTKEFRFAVHELGVIASGNTATGRHVKVMLPQGIKLDLFIPQAHDYYRQLAIRTGPAEYSHRVLARAWTHKGWVGTRDGLRRANQCSCDARRISWTCVEPSPTLPPAWRSEQEFYAFLGLPYTWPDRRQDPKPRHSHHSNLPVGRQPGISR